MMTSEQMQLDESILAKAFPSEVLPQGPRSSQCVISRRTDGKQSLKVAATQGQR